jgi:hypothetical protein
MESASFGMHAAAYAVPFPVTSGIAPAAHEAEDREQRTEDRENQSMLASPQAADSSSSDL